jgi:hypothetical protein
MTAPSYPNQISALDIATEFSAPATNIGVDSFHTAHPAGYVPPNTYGYPQGYATVIPSTPGTQISYGNFHGARRLIPGNSGSLTSGTSYTVPAATNKISIFAIGGGGGGGGGTWRNGDWQGFWTGGGGGGAGGTGLGTNIPIAPGSTISYSIGGGGGAGEQTMGQFFPRGSPGGTGGTTTVTLTVKAPTPYQIQITGGGGTGGTVSSSGGGGGGGGAGYLAGDAGAGSVDRTTQGGLGGVGHGFDTAPGKSPGSILFACPPGSNPGQYSGVYPTTGPGQGAGGTGGGVVQADRGPAVNAVASAGSGGAVFLWWDY